MINKAMQKDQVGLTIGVLDIYGFEIFMVSKCVYKCYKYFPGQSECECECVYVYVCVCVCVDVHFGRRKETYPIVASP